MAAACYIKGIPTFKRFAVTPNMAHSLVKANVLRPTARLMVFELVEEKADVLWQLLRVPTNEIQESYAQDTEV